LTSSTIWSVTPLLLECERDGATASGKAVCGLDPRGRDRLVRVEEVLHHHHGVVPLLDRLPVEVRGELRERLRVVVDGDRDVLLRGAELVPDLAVQGIREARHGVILPSRRHVDSRMPRA
jgi:diadenosine tetraphosphatase ApaH/serine/threonine PP2A family protein phosphatase